MRLFDIHEPGMTPLPHEGEVAVGIDLGTTNSLVAVSRGGRPEVIRSVSGEALLPSVVAYSGSVAVVGEEAKPFPGAVHSIKRLMGVEAKRPVEISAEILRKLKERAETALGKSVTKAVVTVPAYFDDAARTATKDAARLAGLEVLRLINEPTAAALAYGLDKGAEGIYAVYDLGGGTFDVSILRMEKGVFQVLATGGDTRLGGDDFDELIARAKGIGVHAAREIKHKGSREFDGLFLPLVEKTIGICKAALKDAGLAQGDIKGVVLVGGSTRLALVAEKVGEFFGKAPLSDINPDEVVALGAAIQAEGLVHGSDNLLLDVIPLSLGLETMGGIAEKIIYRNTPIPCSYAQEFTTYQDNQTGMIINVVQGEREMAAECRALGSFELSGIPPMAAGAARVRVSFTVDADGLLTVSAQEETTGTEQKIAVKPAYGLAEGEIERMIEESMKNARPDMEKRLLQEARVEAERMIIAVESALEADGSMLSQAEFRKVKEGVSALRSAMPKETREKISALTEDLNNATQDFAALRMNQAVAGKLKGSEV